jgi:WD40 repeat protein
MEAVRTALMTDGGVEKIKNTLKLGKYDTVDEALVFKICQTYALDFIILAVVDEKGALNINWVARLPDGQYKEEKEKFEFEAESSDVLFTIRYGFPRPTMDKGKQYAITLESPISAIAYSPNRTSIVIATELGEALLIDIDTGLQLRSITAHGTTKVNGITFVDTNRLAMACEDGRIMIYSTTGELLFTIDTKTRIFSLAAKHGRIAAATTHGLLLFDAASYQALKSPYGSTAILSLAFHPKKPQIMVAGPGGVFKIDLETETSSKTAVNMPIRIISQSLSGLYAAASNIDGTISVIKTTTGELIKSFPANEETLLGSVFSPNEQCIVSVGNTGLHSFLLSNGEKISKFETAANLVAVHPDHRSFITASEKTLTIWQTPETKGSIKVINMTKTDIEFAIEDKIAGKIAAGKEAVFTIGIGTEIPVSIPLHPEYLLYKDSTLTQTVSVAYGTKPVLTVEEPPLPEPLKLRFTNSTMSRALIPRSVALSDSRKMLVGFETPSGKTPLYSTACLVDLTTGRTTLWLKTGATGIVCSAFTNTNMVLLISVSNSLELYNPNNGEKIKSTHLRLEPVGLACSATDPRLMIFDTQGITIFNSETLDLIENVVIDKKIKNAYFAGKNIIITHAEGTTVYDGTSKKNYNINSGLELPPQKESPAGVHIVNNTVEYWKDNIKVATFTFLKNFEWAALTNRAFISSLYFEVERLLAIDMPDGSTRKFTAQDQSIYNNDYVVVKELQK